MLPSQGLAVIWGPAKNGKSFVAFDKVMHVALGPSLSGAVACDRVPSSIVRSRGAQGFKRRVAAFRQELLGSHNGRVPFILAPTPLSLVSDHPALIASIRASLGAEAPAVITIDTVNRSLTGSESDDRDMGAYIKAGDAVREAFGCLVLLIHHCGVDTSRMRGHTSLAGAVDAQIAVKKTEDGLITATLEAFKDGAAGEVIVSRLRAVEIGVDDEGDVITSCVVDPADDEAPATKDITSKGPKLPDRVRLGLEVLVDCALTSGQPLPSHYEIPGTQRAVPIATWRDALFARGVLDRDAKNPREDFRRVKCALLARHFAGERDGLVWPVTR